MTDEIINRQNPAKMRTKQKKKDAKKNPDTRYSGKFDRSKKKRL